MDVRDIIAQSAEDRIKKSPQNTKVLQANIHSTYYELSFVQKKKLQFEETLHLAPRDNTEKRQALNCRAIIAWCQ